MSIKIEDAANAIIDHLKRSPVLNKTVDFVEQAINKLNQNFQHQPIGLDELISGLSDETDKTILQIQQQESLRFIGGELHVSKESKQISYFSIDLKLYFQNQMEKIILKETHKELQISILNDESKNDLFQKGIIKYEVNEPNIKG